MDKVALITGVGPGTGSAIARRFHEGGYRVAALARDAVRLDRLTAQLPGCLPIACDVADFAALEIAHDRVVAALGPVDVLVHNAVRGTRGDVLQIDPQDLERNFAINVAYFVIDAVIDVPWTRAAFPDKPDDYFAKPPAIAESVWQVAHQDRSAWSFDVELRPFGETW